MLTKTVLTSSLLAALAAAAPKPQYGAYSSYVPGYTNADASFSVHDPTGVPASVFGPDSQVPVSFAFDSLRKFQVLTFTRRKQPQLHQPTLDEALM
jgi:hypothetical protein